MQTHDVRTRTAISVALASVAVVCQAACRDSDSDNLSVSQVEAAFASAGERLERNTSGAFRVPETGEPRVCGWLHSSDFWIGVSVCRRWDDDFLPIQRIPAPPPVREFDNPDKMLRWLARRASSGGPGKRSVALLNVDYRNLTVLYFGRDAARVRRIDAALDDLGAT